MKFCLIHCYSDNNKGDLGIILSTIQLLKEYDPSAAICAVSTYNYDDPAFCTEHGILRQYTEVYPSIFGELNIGKRKDTVSKFVRLIWDSSRLLLLLLFKSKFFLSREERKSLDQIAQSDYIISKGGSFLCNENDIRSKLANFRFSFLFLVIFRLFPQKRVVILCQSLGPIYGNFSTWLMNYVLKKCDKIVLREDTCVRTYPNIIIPEKKMFCQNDIAFQLQVDPLSETIINNGNDRIKVGVTMKTMAKQRNSNYQKMMTESLEYIISKYSVDLYIFPHVTIDDDVEASFRIYRKIADKYKEHIVFLTGNYTSGELKNIYGRMDFMIASRLHSSIFAIGEGTPAIVIAYHGTKAQGVLSNYGLENWVVKKYSSEVLNNKIDEMIREYKVLRPTLKSKVEREHQSFIELFNQVFPSESGAKKSS